MGMGFIRMQMVILTRGNLLMENGFTLPYVSMTDDNNKVSYMPKGDFSSKLFVFNKI